MSRAKGTDLVNIKLLLKEKGPQAVAAFLGSLSPEFKSVWENATFLTWTSVEIMAGLYEAAAQAIFPGDPTPIFSLGKAMAEKSYGGVYKLFLRLPTVSFLIKGSAQLWRTYYDSGNVSIENVTSGSAVFIVRSFPDLPLTLRITVDSHLAVLIERTGAKNVSVERSDRDPQAWAWKISWER